ncbi:bifunctional helix-turn-helix transcriptional regulator/GNAT family N-acetyltransferase [Sphingomonas sp. AP4-R1]|uniref:bifunctional helix-turn-helix transcriptional regulator/GNAT family N-acetyltransferase n=1 Tax=Sphingomonas sp. AP4-R1 TaxID=2735134 RepID=UPI001493314B|nr:bifunctional helix-turn-helix transcriptional regulator/GNAT family N-acetyltransferase [Sphingomonas sp. AP4-R1]
MRDIVTERAQLFLGSRLKRLAEKMQADVVKISERIGLAVQPGQYALLATLDLDGPQTIGELTEALQLSQPAITRTVAKLSEMGLVEVARRGRDQRHKTVALTAEGEAAMARAKSLLWPQIEGAVGDMLGDLAGPFLANLGHIEERMSERPLHRRAVEAAQQGLVIHDYSDALAPHFRTINGQWIEAMYRLEQTDIDVLDHPRERIIDGGGTILFVEAPGLGIVGACALQKTGPDQYELTKMGVLESARGLKAGEFLLKAMIAKAGEMGARRLYLLSNRKSEAAIHLYEKLGFAHDAGIMAEFGARYARCDVAMLYRG